MSAAGPGREAALRDELALFRPLLALSMVMTNTRDETSILRIATSSVPALGGCRTEAVLFGDLWWSDGHDGRLRSRLEMLGQTEGPVDVGTGWAWAYSLANSARVPGHLVVSRDTEPAQHHRFLLKVLAQQTAVALANAVMRGRERESLERERVANAELQRSLDIHNRLTAVASAGGGQEGIAHAVHELTGLVVAVEDRHGNLTAWAGSGRPDPYPKAPAAQRERLLHRLITAHEPVRDGDRLIVAAQVGSDVLGVLALVDPERAAHDTERVALEHGNTVLTLELAHQRALAEVELRLRRDLVEELLAGTDTGGARERARALGYDLARPHRVLLVAHGGQRGNHEHLFDAVRHAFSAVGIGSLLATRPGGVAVLCHTDHDWERLRKAIETRLGARGRCRVGVGAPCVDPPDFPRSHGQAQLALKMQITTGSPPQVTVFDDLGVYRLLSEISDIGSVESFIHRWLGTLLDYDTAKGAQLVETLSEYLEHGGNYDETSRRLALHRSTLRYRLQRIRSVSGYELNDPDTRFNLQLATRAWTTVHTMHDRT
ncbi:PucR family transcriptional regulator [Lentzea aerocolonigenes]|uniref:PucR family transcriptional regulator n=1 Tax=Lentzea aerocolonigenes TaxID=68170 RepID=UPI0005655714|nr:helix-turn-helix domain-containing protein [Lentzea aerocolonigenes]MCP2242396.1 PucR C-terminal helix-turn-helix domain-containing protein [Lentzea aerocolonigenes]